MSLRVKTILGVACIEAVLLLILISTTLNFLRTTNYDGLLKQSVTTAKLFNSTTKDAVISYDLASLQSFVTEFLTIPDIVYVRIVDMQGRVFAEAGDAIYLDRAFQLDINPQEVTDGVFDQSTLITEGGADFAIIQFGIDINAIQQTLDEATQRSTLIAVVEMGLVALFSLLLGTYLTRQLRGLQRGANSISEGDLDIEIEVKGKDEVAQVSEAFNVMVNNLKEASERRKKYEKELLDFNQHLEERVEQRTAELNKKYEELEAANHQIKAAQTQLLSSEKMASVGLLAAGVAHEINNPMSFIMSNLRTLSLYTQNYLTIIQEYQKLAALVDLEQQNQQRKYINQLSEKMDLDFQTEDVVELLDDSIEGAIRVRDIVSGLKDFSRVDSDENFVLHNVNECIESTIKVSSSAIKYQCEIRKELSTLPDTYCLPGHINQVIVNLLVNASYAIEAVKVKGVIIIRSRVEDDCIVVEVEDNGSGIPEENLMTIFDPFYTTKPFGEGTGLGLAISFGIIEDHGGTIEVKSELGKGTCFKVRLPITTAPPIRK